LFETSIPEGARDWQPPPLPQAPPGRALTLRTAAGADAADVEVWVLQLEGNRWQPLARQRTDGMGRVSVALAEPARCLVLALDPQHAPLAVPGDQIPANGRLTLDRGRTLRITCIDGDGAAIPLAALELAPTGLPEAALSVTCDDRGIAMVQHAPSAACRLLAVDSRYANQGVDVDPRDDVIRLQLHAGARVNGRVRLPDGAAAEGVAVTIRDQSGRMRPASRTVLADAQGGFAFGGLPEGGVFVLFAQQQRQGRKWSADLQQVTPAREWNLELRCEDHPLPGGEHR
jgi:hypothetical protein